MRIYLKYIVLTAMMLWFSAQVKAQCGTAYVSSDDTVICIPQIVKFKVSAFAVNTKFEWDFGSGYIPGDSTASKLYTVAGSYTVSVKLKYPDGSFCIINMTDFIKARSSPKAAISAAKSVLCHGEDSVLLTDNTPNSASRDWVINNVLFANAPKSVFAHYTLPTGEYKSAYIFVRDIYGCQAKQSFDSIVYMPDTAKLDLKASSINGCSPKLVSFVPQIDSGKQKILTYQWTFPGATPASSTAKNPSGIRYTGSDTFDVGLKVTTDLGCTYIFTKKDYLAFVDSLNLNVSFSATKLCAGKLLTVTLNNARTLPFGLSATPSNYKVVYDVNNVKRIKFGATGTYSFVISDTTGSCVSVKTFSNYVQADGPLADFTVDHSRSCTLPDTFIFTNTSSVTGAQPVSYRWTVRNDTTGTNDTTATSASLTAILRKLGGRTVTLIASGSNGCADTLKRPLAVEIAKIRPDFTWQPLAACPKEPVYFTNATKPGSSKVRNQYRWTFYDTIVPVKNILGTDTAVNPNKSYTDTGRYSVKLVAYNSLGCKDSVIKTRKINVLIPKPVITVVDSLPCRGQSTTKLKVTLPPEFKGFVFRWEFKHRDSTGVLISMPGDSVQPVFDEPGIYDIKLNCYSASGGCYIPFNLPNHIRVSGAKYKLTVSPNTGCNPQLSSFSATLLNARNYKNSNTSPYTFRWSANRPGDVTIFSPTAQTTNAIFKEKASYVVKLNYSSPSLCADSNQVGPIVIGVKSYGYAPSNACVDKLMGTKNFSSQNPVRYKWYIDTGSSYQFYPSDTSFEPKIMFRKKGTYKLALIAYGKGGCADTSYTVIGVNVIKSNFTSSDTINYCAPAIVSFQGVTDNNIFRYNWNFGDGDTFVTTNAIVSHVYRTNTGPPGRDVRLIVQGYGCFDTIVKPGFVKIIGPVPGFTMSNTDGCEPLNVRFTNTSKYFSRFYLDFGDGTTLDSSGFNQHTYRVYDRSLDYQVYKPMLALIDSFGCSVAYQSPDSVVTRKSPIADFTVPALNGCEVFNVAFRNISDNAQNFYWDFDNDGVTDSKELFPKHDYAAGDHYPALIAEGVNGCRDTIKNKYRIRVYKRPVASYTTDRDTVCYNAPIQFSGMAAPDSIITKWQWDFGEPFSFTDTSTKRNVTYRYKNPYLNQAVLLITDKHGCKDTAERFIYVYDTIPPQHVGINYVTVVNNKDIYINWAKSNYNRFNGYHLYEDRSGYILVHSTSQRNDTDYTVTSGVDVNLQTYGYNMKIEDNCNIIGKFSKSHFTIFTRLSNLVPNQIQVNWGHYQGWTRVLKYYIYRSKGAGPYVLLDSVPGDVNSYDDKDLCDETYCYYIVALHPAKVWRSTSNTACGKPVYVKPVVQVTPIVATVTDDNLTYTRWQPYGAVAKVKRYIIERSNGGGFNQNYDVSDSSGYIDRRVDVNEYSYAYKIKAEDHCGNITPASEISKTILLKATSLNYVTGLSWTPYELWDVGVKQYSVQVRDAGGNFQHVAWVSKDSTSFEHNFEDVAMADSLCFRVVAYRNDNSNVTSQSNIACTISESQMWVPNAFSPNDDGHNDVFLPRAILIYNKTGNTLLDYKIEIYNRWGGKVFESNDVKIGWDGTCEGKDCEAGVYIYKIKALGLDGRYFNFEGNITLNR